MRINKRKISLIVLLNIIHNLIEGSDESDDIRVEYVKYFDKSNAYIATHEASNKKGEWIRTKLVYHSDGTETYTAERSIWCGEFGCEDVWVDVKPNDQLLLDLRTKINKKLNKK